MKARRKNISTRLMLLFLMTGLLLLLVFGLMSIERVRKTTRLSVTEGNRRLGWRAAQLIEQYVQNALSILESTSENINHADLKDWQKERILKNSINRFEEFNALSIRSPDGTLVAASQLNLAETENTTTLEKEAIEAVVSGKNFLSKVYIRKDLSPAMLAAFPARHLAALDGVLLAELNLLHMWTLVDSIRAGQKGVLHVVDPDGHLIATGDGARKKDVFQGKFYEPLDRLQDIVKNGGAVFKNPSGIEVLSIGYRLAAPLGWSTIVEEPTSEAYALATRMTFLLIGIMGVMVVLACLSGYFGGKLGVVNPVKTLLFGIREIAQGRWEHRVNLSTDDEFEDLAHAINDMAIRLSGIQQKLIVEERHALFGRIASGLAHDLKHPLQAIENASHLLERFYEDSEFRQTFQKTLEREFTKINFFLENLHNLTQEVPFRPVSLVISSVIEDALASFRIQAEKQNIVIVTRYTDPLFSIAVDPTSFNRALCNLISNAVQVMPEGGRLTVSVSRDVSHIKIEIEDTGPGIPEERRKSLFDDFFTTKWKGLGLGLAITQKIVKKHGGIILVEEASEGGARFVILLPGSISAEMR